MFAKAEGSSFESEVLGRIGKNSDLFEMKIPNAFGQIFRGDDKLEKEGMGDGGWGMGEHTFES